MQRAHTDVHAVLAPTPTLSACTAASLTAGRASRSGYQIASMKDCGGHTCSDHCVHKHPTGSDHYVYRVHAQLRQALAKTAWCMLPECFLRMPSPCKPHQHLYQRPAPVTIGPTPPLAATPTSIQSGNLCPPNTPLQLHPHPHPSVHRWTHTSKPWPPCCVLQPAPAHHPSAFGKAPVTGALRALTCTFNTGELLPLTVAFYQPALPPCSPPLTPVRFPCHPLYAHPPQQSSHTLLTASP
jgi:hypothetical protein